MTQYLVSCGLLIVPILVWNAVFTRYLPPALASDFNRGIPGPLLAAENVLRTAVMILPFLMPLDVKSAARRGGFWVFVAGVLLYLLAWVPLMIAPESAWSTSRAGFLAPAYTPVVWLVGLGLTGGQLYGSVPFKSWMYLLLAGAFVSVHVAHAFLVYARTYATHP